MIARRIRQFTGVAAATFLIAAPGTAAFAQAADDCAAPAEGSAAGTPENCEIEVLPERVDRVAPAPDPSDVQNRNLPNTGGDNLPNTGVESTGLAAIAVGAIVVGAGAVAGTRRRKSTSV